MSNNFKFNFNKLTNIEIYDLILHGRLSSFPSGFWSNTNIEDAKQIALELLHYLIDEKLKLSKEEIKKVVSKKILTKNKLHTASKLFGRSAIRYVMSAYPGYFQPWQFNQDRVPQSFWTSEQNRVNALKYTFQVELNWDIEDIKEKLDWNIIRMNGLMTLHRYYPNLYILVDAVYPNSIYPWELMNSEVPNGTWEVKSNRILAIKWLINKLNINNKKINKRAFAEYGLSKLLGNYYCDSVKKAILEVPYVDAQFHNIK